MMVELGKVCATPALLAVVSNDDIQRALRRHEAGDSGIVSRSDSLMNDSALLAGERILSEYKSREGIVFWIITEADRSLTTALLPDDY